jgi:hypothetical protein
LLEKDLDETRQELFDTTEAKRTADMKNSAYEAQIVKLNDEIFRLNSELSEMNKMRLLIIELENFRR